jgi:hypothetical protein
VYVFEPAVNGNAEELGSSSGDSDGRLSVRDKTTRRDGTDSLAQKLRCFPVSSYKGLTVRRDELRWLVTVALLCDMWDFLAPGPGTQHLLQAPIECVEKMTITTLAGSDLCDLLFEDPYVERRGRSPCPKVTP